VLRLIGRSKYICKDIRLSSFGIINYLHRLQLQINDIKSDSNRTDDTLETYRHHSNFIDQVVEFKGINKIVDPYDGKSKTQSASQANPISPNNPNNVFITGSNILHPAANLPSNKVNMVPITHKGLLQLFVDIEEENLFLMNHIQEKELHLEKHIRDQEANINEKRQEIAKVSKNKSLLENKLESTNNVE
jgi:hypothetical protein